MQKLIIVSGSVPDSPITSRLKKLKWIERIENVMDSLDPDNENHLPLHADCAMLLYRMGVSMS